MYEKESLGRRIVIKTWRKARGGRGKERSGSTGKRGWLYTTATNGTETLVYDTGKCATFDEVQRKLRSTNLIPTDVALKNTRETTF